MDAPTASGGMTSRQRFQETLAYGSPDRVPYFEEGLREEVLAAWRKQGLPQDAAAQELFPADQWQEIQPDLDPHPPFTRWPTDIDKLDDFSRRLDAEDLSRLPPDWAETLRNAAHDGRVNLLRVHRGFFLSLGVQSWPRFNELMELLLDAPEFVRRAMEIQGRFAARIADKLLTMMPVDAAVFSEPIGGNGGPLISPNMYEKLALSSYRPLITTLRKHGVKNLIFRTYANARILIPKILEHGFNCLWACEVNLKAMDYRDLRREFGKELRLIGGIDLDALRQGQAAIRQELSEKLPPLLAQGGYIPLADGRIRDDVRFTDYVYYRRLLRELTDSKRF